MKGIETKFGVDMLNREDIKNNHNKLEEEIAGFSSQTGILINKAFRYAPLTCTGIVAIMFSYLLHSTIGIRTSVNAVSNGVNTLGNGVDAVVNSFVDIEKLVVRAYKKVSSSYSHDLDDVNEMLKLKANYYDRLKRIVDNMHMYEGKYNKLILANAEQMILQRDPHKLIRFCDNVLFFNQDLIRECQHTTLMVYKHLHLVAGEDLKEIMDVSTFYKFLRLNSLDTRWRDFTSDEMSPYKNIEDYYVQFPDLRSENPAFDYFGTVINTKKEKEEEVEQVEQVEQVEEKKEEKEEEKKVEQVEQVEEKEEEQREEIEHNDIVDESWWRRKCHSVKNYVLSFFYDNNNAALEAESANNTISTDTIYENITNSDNIYTNQTGIDYESPFVDGIWNQNQTNLLGNSTDVNSMNDNSLSLLGAAATIGLAMLGARKLLTRNDRNHRNTNSVSALPIRSSDNQHSNQAAEEIQGSNTENQGDKVRIHMYTDNDRRRDKHIQELTNKIKEEEEADIENQKDEK